MRTYAGEGTGKWVFITLALLAATATLTLFQGMTVA